MFSENIINLLVAPMHHYQNASIQDSACRNYHMQIQDIMDIMFLISKSIRQT